MSLTLPLISSLKKQSPPLGTDPLSVLYSIILCIHHMYSTYLGYIWNGLRPSDVLRLFKDGKLKQALLHMTTWLSSTFFYWSYKLLSLPFSGGSACSCPFTPTYPMQHGKASGETKIFSLHSFCQLYSFVLPENPIISDLQNKIFSDFSILVTCRWDNLIFYFAERLLSCIILLIVNVSFLVAA